MATGVKNLLILLALVFLVAIVGVGFAVNASGHVEVVHAFDPARGELPEGITIDKSGNMYVTLGAPAFAGGGLGEVWKITPEGTSTVLAQFDFPGVSGPAGLAVDAAGNVYFAYPAADPAFNGVYQIVEGVPVPLPGTENIIVANGLAFDKQGNLYVSDSILGAIWRISRDRDAAAEVWIQDALLAGCETDPIGANGIAYWKGSFYVANTTKGLLVNIPIMTDGSAGTPEVVAGEDDQCAPGIDDLEAMDGIALDVHGKVYALLVLQNKFVRIDPLDGTYETLLTSEDGLWNPASITFGTGKGDRQKVFITNYAVLDEPANNLGPAILKFDVGQPGLPLP